MAKVMLDGRGTPSMRERRAEAKLPGLYEFGVGWGVVLIALSIVWPRYGFYALGGLPQFTPFTLMAILSWALLPALIFLNHSAREQFFTSLRSTYILLSFLGAWICWRLVASAFGEDPAESLVLTAQAIVYLLPVLFMGLLVSNAVDGNVLIVRTVLISAIVVLGLAVLESAIKRPVVDILGLRFATDAQAAMNATEISIRGGSMRYKSVFYHPIVFGQFLAFVFPLALWSLIQERLLLMRLLALTVILMTPWAVGITGSRAAILGLAVAAFSFAVIYAVHRSKKGAYGGVLIMIFVALTSIAAFGLLSGQILDLFLGRNTSEVSSSLYRSAMFSRGFDEIAYSPLSGFGDGRSPYHAGFAAGPNIVTIDSLYLSTLLDNGWIGLVLFLAVWITYFWSAFVKILAGKRLDVAGAFLAGTLSLFSIFSILSIADNITLLFVAIVASYTRLELEGRKIASRSYLGSGLIARRAR
ncbi:O-antigen ligase family protein [Brevundimonas sp. TWP2-3-2]|uniref:O-antigen ligase family protein n=1 Tax=unclassified Brevundimonas TaxID=2622653 RepID=UPI003CEFF781